MEIRKKLGAKKAEKSLEISAFLILLFVFRRVDGGDAAFPFSLYYKIAGSTRVAKQITP